MGLNFATTLNQGTQKGTDATVFKTKLALNWIGPFKILAVGTAPASDVPDNRSLHDKHLYLDVPSGLPGRDFERRVSVERCKPYRRPGDTSDVPKYLPSDLTQYVLNSFSAKSPRFHVTLDDVSPQPERLEVEQITDHHLVRGRGGVITVLYETHWVGLLSPSCERELDLHHSRRYILLYWSGTPTQHRQENRLDRQMRTCAAQRELSRSQCQIYLAPRIHPRPLRPLAPHVQLHLTSARSTPLVQGPRRPVVAWQDHPSRHLGSPFRNTLELSSNNTYIVRFLDEPGPIEINLRSANYTIASSTNELRIVVFATP